MSKALNNFCESLVNGSNPRYTHSQPSIAEQVAWQVKKEEEARQAQINDTINRMHKAQYDNLHSSFSTPSSTASYTPSYTPSSTASYTPSFTPSLTSSFSSPSPSYSSSLPTYGKYSWEK